MRKIFLLVILYCISATSYSQILADSVIFEKFNSYAKTHPEIILFTHIDKTLYTNNETIWFSSYLVENTLTDTLKKHSILSVVLTNEDTKKIFLQTQFLMEEGLSFGSVDLTDSIPPGNYRLLTFTNILDTTGYPLAFSDQALTIKSITQPLFKATLSLLDTIPVNGVILAKITATTEKTASESFEIKYTIGEFQSKSITLRSQEVSHIIEVPAKYLNASNPVLTCSIQLKDEIQYLNVVLPEIGRETINVRLFPEGGSLVDNVGSVIAFESLTSRDLPVSIKGVLFENDLPIDTVVSNSYGVGVFKLKPKTGGYYTLRVQANNFLSKDTSYQLPATLSKGLVLHLKKAVVNDTLQMQVFSKPAQRIQVLIHNKQRAYASFMMNANLNGSPATIALTGVPKGLNTLTVLDSAGRPIAERLFFAHYDQRINAEITSNRKEYEKRENVVLNIKLSDKNNLPLAGLLSVAVVQESRIEGHKAKDIVTETYLTHGIGAIPGNPSGNAFGDPAFLENILLVRGWRNYTWQNIMKAQGGNLIRVTAPRMTGHVMSNGKSYKKISSVSIIRDSLIDNYTTRSDGTWTLPEEKLVIAQNSVLRASIHKQPQPLYITIDNPLIETGNVLSKGLKAQPEFSSLRAESSTHIMHGLEGVIALQEFIITADPLKNVIYKGASGQNACGDYVCEYGVLNCPAHLGSSSYQPIKGQKYLWVTGMEKPGMASGLRTYQGCKHERDLEGIYLAKEFYGVDVSQEGKLRPQFLSTLAWKPGLLANTDGIVSFEFFTGDISDTFSIVVQGVTAQGVVSGTSSIKVK